MGIFNPAGVFSAVRPKMAFFGDSITAASTAQDTDIATYNFNLGPQSWIEVLTHQRIRTDKSLNFGISGNTSTQMRARVDEVAGCDADIMWVLAGANDPSDGVTSEEVELFAENMTYIYQRLLNSGKIVIAIPTLNRSLLNPASDNTAATIQGMQRWVVAQQHRGYRNFYVVDPNFNWTDPTSTTSAPKTYYDYDGLHPRGLGMYWICRPVADLLNQLFPMPYAQPMVSVRDVYNATYNPYGNLLPAGLLAGSNVNTGSGGPTFTGNWADNLTILGSAGTGGTITGLTVDGSKTTMLDGAIAQQVVISGTGTGSGASPGSGIILRESVSSPGTKVAAGDRTTAYARIEIEDDTTNIAGIRLRARYTEGGVTYDHVSQWDGIADLLPTVNDSWTLRTPTRTSLSAPSAMEFSIWITLRNQSAATFAGTIRTGQWFWGKEFPF